MTSLDSILKSINITLQIKVCVVKAMVFAVIMYECESWTIKKAECQGIDAFELWCWRRLLRVPWRARRSNQSILQEISLSVHWMDWCWSWNSNTLATHLKRPWCWERLRPGGEGDDRRWDGWMALTTQWTWASSGRWWRTGKPGMLHAVHGVTKSWTWLSDWTPPPIDVYEILSPSVKVHKIHHLYTQQPYESNSLNFQVTTQLKSIS